jgi:hypothetical protein
MSFAAGDDVVAAEHVHNFVKRTGTSTNISGGWTAVPFATLAQGSMVGISTSDNITFTLTTGLWQVHATVSPATNVAAIAALFEGGNVDPVNAANTEVYSIVSGTNTGSVGGVTVSAEIYVPSGTRTFRVSAFASGASLRNTGPAIPRLTVSWRF